MRHVERDRPVFLDQALDLPNRRYARGVISAAELSANIRIGPRRKVLGEIDGNLARKADIYVPPAGIHVEDTDAEVLSNALLDLADGRILRFWERIEPVQPGMEGGR